MSAWISRVKNQFMQNIGTLLVAIILSASSGLYYATIYVVDYLNEKDREQKQATIDLAHNARVSYAAETLYTALSYAKTPLDAENELLHRIEIHDSAVVAAARVLCNDKDLPQIEKIVGTHEAALSVCRIVH